MLKTQLLATPSKFEGSDHAVVFIHEYFAN